MEDPGMKLMKKFLALFTAGVVFMTSVGSLSLRSGMFAAAITEDSYDFRVDHDYYVYAEPNKPFTLEVRVSGKNAAATTFQWYKADPNAVFDYSKLEIIEGATSSSYTIAKVDKFMAYACIVSNGSEQSYCPTWVFADNHFDIDLKASVLDVNVKPGEDVTLSAVTVGDDLSDVKYEWYNTNTCEVEGTTATLTLNNLQKPRNYNITATDKFGNSVSAGAQIKVNHLTVKSKDGRYNYAVSTGSSKKIELEVTADDMSGITYEWSSIDIFSEEGTVIGNTKDCTVQKTEDSMKVQVKVCDKYNNEETLLFILDDMTVWPVPTTDDYYLPDSYHIILNPHQIGTTQKLTVQADSLAGDTFTYRWLVSEHYEDYHELPYSVNEPTIIVKSGKEMSYTEYCVEVTDSNGKMATVNFTVFFEFSTLRGDVNQDNDRTAEDLTMLARHVAKIEELDNYGALDCADVDESSDINAGDLTMLARHVAKIEELPD